MAQSTGSASQEIEGERLNVSNVESALNISELSEKSEDVDPELIKLLENALRLDTVMYFPKELLRTELSRRGLPLSQKKVECAQQIIDDNRVRAASIAETTVQRPIDSTGEAFHDSEIGQDGVTGRRCTGTNEGENREAGNEDVMTTSNAYESPRNPTPSANPSYSPIEPRKQHESSEDFYARAFLAMSQTMLEVQRQVANSTKTIEVHTTPDISNTLPQFSAKSDEGAWEFIKAVERAAGQQKWNSSLTVAMAASKLLGEAKSWHGTTGIDLEDDWDDWKNAFLEHFGKETSFAEWQSAVKSRVQRSDEPISAFIQEKLKLFKRSRYGKTLTLQDKIDSICEGIHNDATRTLLWNTYSSMEDFVQAASVRQRHDDFVASQRIAKRKVTANDAKRNSEYEETTDRKREDDGRKASWVKPRDRPVFLRNRNNRDKCYNCFELGHLSRDCPKPKTERTLKAEKERSAKSLKEQTAVKTEQPKTERQANCFLKTVKSGLPIVSATLANKQLNVCIDTGANVSIIREACVPPGIRMYRWIGAESVKVMDRSFEPQRAITAEVTVGNVKVFLPNVIVSEHCPFDMLLGSDWRELANVDVTFHPNNDVTMVAVDQDGNLLDDQNRSNLHRQGETLIISCCQIVPEEKEVVRQDDFLILKTMNSAERKNDDILSANIEAAVAAASRDMNEVQRQRLREILIRNHKAFVSETDTIGLCPHTKHSIELRDKIPVVCRPYRCSPADREFLRQQVDDYLKKGIIQESDSEYASPTLIVNQPHHPTTPRRMVHDYRQLNAKTVSTPFELMHGFQPRLPGELNIGMIAEELSEAERLHELAKDRGRARQHLIESSRQQKERYDGQHQAPKFQVGDKVLYPMGQRSNTLEPYFEEPHEIVEFLNDNTVRIKVWFRYQTERTSRRPTCNNCDVTVRLNLNLKAISTNTISTLLCLTNRDPRTNPEMIMPTRILQNRSKRRSKPKT